MKLLLKTLFALCAAALLAGCQISALGDHAKRGNQAHKDGNLTTTKKMGPRKPLTTLGDGPDKEITEGVNAPKKSTSTIPDDLNRGQQKFEDERKAE